MGVVICMGTSPGAAANKAITNGLVESERAKIVMVPDTYIEVLRPYMDRLLNLDEAEKAGAATGVEMIRE